MNYAASRERHIKTEARSVQRSTFDMVVNCMNFDPERAGGKSSAYPLPGEQWATAPKEQPCHREGHPTVFWLKAQISAHMMNKYGTSPRQLPPHLRKRLEKEVAWQPSKKEPPEGMANRKYRKHSIPWPDQIFDTPLIVSTANTWQSDRANNKFDKKDIPEPFHRH